jgi:hypothetical protein
MATWKKVVVSGSAISQLINDANYAITSSISGAFTAASGGFSIRITTLETNGTTNALTASFVNANDVEFIGGNGQTATDVSSSVSTRITTNTTNIATLTSATSSYALKTDISGAFTSVSSSIAADIASLEAAVGAGGTLISSSAEGDVQGQIKLNGVNVDINNLGTNDSPSFVNLTLTGDLTVQGDVTSLQTTNVNVEDQFILLNSGSGDADGGLVINGAGSAIGWDSSEGRFALDYAGATWNQTSITSDAFVASVVTTDDANYRKVGNIRIDTASQDIFIYS